MYLVDGLPQPDWIACLLDLAEVGMAFDHLL
jgi:hypothetical protein